MNTADYSFYISASYAISFVVLIAAMIWPLLQHRRILRDLRRMQHRQSQLEKRRT
jgi:heme exporter protein CcmD